MKNKERRYHGLEKKDRSIAIYEMRIADPLKNSFRKIARVFDIDIKSVHRAFKREAIRRGVVFEKKPKAQKIKHVYKVNRSEIPLNRNDFKKNDFDKRALAIIKLRSDGYTGKAIARFFNISGERVRQIMLNPFPSRRGRLKHGVGIKYTGRDFLRELVRLRDKNTCQQCMKVWTEGMRKFDVHHLDSEVEGDEGKKYENNKDMSQLITLCHKCHLNLHTVREKMRDGRVI